MIFLNSRHVMTLANSIIGVGILAMPFCFQKCGIILAIFLLILNNCITRICCRYLIKTSLLTRRKSYEFLGFHAFGTSGKLLVELCIIGYLLGTCVTYFVVVGDLGPQIVMEVLSISKPSHHLRMWIIIAVTLICILPLGMLKNIESLATVCTASVAFYVCFVLKIVFESEKHIVANDWTQNVTYWQPSGVLQCLPILNMALSCQMQLFEVLQSINNQSPDKLNDIVKNATWACTWVYIAVGFFGYVAFSSQMLSGNILMNFTPSLSSDVIKIGFVMSVAFSFPLVIFPCRASIYSLLYRKGHGDNTTYMPEKRFKAITVFIVMLSLCIALMIPSVELVIGMVGSTIGVAICILFPASCFCKIVKKNSSERTLANFIIVSGFCLMVLGTYANLNAIDMKRSETDFIENHERPTIEETADTAKVIVKPSLEINLSQLDNVAKASIKVAAKNDDGAKKIEREKDPVIVPTLISPSLPINVPKESERKDQHESKDDAESKKIQQSIVPEKVDSSLKVVDSPKVNDKKKVSLEDALRKDVISKDAIKKEDDIAAEELKVNTAVKSVETAELKKAQTELKETKELFERRVVELKEELAKKNAETQHLLAEIERKISNGEAIKHRGDINLSRTNETAAIVRKNASSMPDAPTGSEKRAALNTKEREQRPPLPLPLLIVNTPEVADNRSIIKSNGDKTMATIEKKNVVDIKVGSETNGGEHKIIVDNPRRKPTNHVDSIRRNISQVKSKHADVPVPEEKHPSIRKEQ